jgi:8-oxo-dGTP pyrophosphatase MutT (NUDIX family)
MRTLAEINRHPNVPHEGNSICREAVRAIISRGREVLLVHSTVNGDYKFPGGGIQSEECHEAALIRETAEESGGRIVSTPEPFGKVMEYDFPLEKCFDTFCMTSYYYRCEIDPELGAQHLDEYEARLGFVPVWVDIDVAIEKNRALLGSGKKYERWVKRETCVLEIVRDELMK